jgi:ketosteroid isomerase-like protein
MSAETEELAARYGAAWADHDLDAIMAMHTEDTVFHLHGGGDPTFAAAMKQWPDIRFERKRVRIGAGHFVSEYQMSASKDGRPIVCDGVDVFTVEGGRVARKDTYLDWIAIQQQLAQAASVPA